MPLTPFTYGLTYNVNTWPDTLMYLAGTFMYRIRSRFSDRIMYPDGCTYADLVNDHPESRLCGDTLVVYDHWDPGQKYTYLRFYIKIKGDKWTQDWTFKRHKADGPHAFSYGPTINIMGLGTTYYKVGRAVVGVDTLINEFGHRRYQYHSGWKDNVPTCIQEGYGIQWGCSCETNWHGPTRCFIYRADGPHFIGAHHNDYNPWRKCGHLARMNVTFGVRRQTD